MASAEEVEVLARTERPEQIIMNDKKEYDDDDDKG